MTFPIAIDDLTVRYRPAGGRAETVAVDGLTLDLAGGAIHGLLGRNGAGKSSLLSVLAGYRRPSSGRALVDGEAPYEHPRLMADTCLVRQHGDFDDGTSVNEVLEFAGDLRPRWDRDQADRLVERFAIPRPAKVGGLSLGQRSALAVTVGLATQAPLTMFDEPHLGMDVPSRVAFYEELLADYFERPRTIILSTHLIEEAASLFEDVVIIDRGRLAAHERADDLRGRGAALVGPADAVDALVGGRRVGGERRLGATKAVTVLDPLDDGDVAAARAAGVEVQPMPLQDLFVALTEPEEALR